MSVCLVVVVLFLHVWHLIHVICLLNFLPHISSSGSELWLLIVWWSSSGSLRSGLSLWIRWRELGGEREERECSGLLADRAYGEPAGLSSLRGDPLWSFLCVSILSRLSSSPSICVFIRVSSFLITCNSSMPNLAVDELLEWALVLLEWVLSRLRLCPVE